MLRREELARGLMCMGRGIGIQVAAHILRVKELISVQRIASIHAGCCRPALMHCQRRHDNKNINAVHVCKGAQKELVASSRGP